MTHRAFASRVLWMVVLASGLSSCGGIVRYTVTKTPTADCIIRANGEFCDEAEQLPPPTTETWAAETIDEKTILYIGEETWVADGTDGERRVVKTERTGSSLCTTTKTRTLVFMNAEFKTDAGERIANATSVHKVLGAS